MHIHHKKNSQGFTLLEVLLAVSIISIILVTVYSTFWGGIRLSHRAQENGGLYRDIQLTMEAIKKDFENMVAYDFSGSYPDKFALMGDENQVTFILPTAEGLKVIRYLLSEQKMGSVHTIIVGQRYKKNVTVTNIDQQQRRVVNLVREESLFVDYLSQNNKFVKQEIISDQVLEDSLKFSYGVNGQEDSNSLVWSSAWKEMRFPGRIKVSLDFSSAGENQSVLSIVRDIFIPLGN